MSFEVTILGSGSALPTLRRNPTAQYVSCNDRHILIDCGEGTQNQLRKFGVKIQKISHILISHMHGDHFFGLVGLLSSMHLLGRDSGITIYGPKELEQIIRLQLEIGGAKMNFNMNFFVLDNSKPTVIFEDKMIEIHAFPMKHRIPVNGFKIQEKAKSFNIIGEVFKSSGLSLMAIPFFKKGEDFVDEDGEIYFADDFVMAKKPPKSYGYCSDTAYFEPLISSIQGVNLLYHEATFVEKLADRAKATFHSTAKDAATIAQKANVGKLILGHLSARYDSGDDHLKEAQTIFENTVIVEDGMVFQV